MMNDAFMSLTMIDSLALLAIVLIGLPHGAFDGALYGLWRDDTDQKLVQKSKIDLIRFLLLYSLCAVLVVFVWLALPVLSLALFLFISAFHFGAGDANSEIRFHRQLQIIAHGGLVTLWLPIMHTQEVGFYFSALSGDRASLLVDGLQAMQWPWLLVVLLYGIRAMRDKEMQVRFIELLLMMLAISHLPVLAGFALYFCAIHSRRHFTVIYHGLHQQKTSKTWPLAISLIIASWVAGGVALLILMTYQSFIISALQIIFIGLAALTVPHMILVDGLYHRAKHRIFA